MLRDVSLRLERGEAVGLLGPNGAGKTTSFYILTGLIQPDSGVVALDGNDITRLPMYRRARIGVGYLPQEASIFRGMTVENNIRAVLEVTEPAPDLREGRLEALLGEFSITHLRRTPGAGAVRRRTAPGGDRAGAGKLAALRAARRTVRRDRSHRGERRPRSGQPSQGPRGIGVLITDHNVRETLDIVDRAYILHDGRVLMEGVPSEIVDDDEVRRVYLGERFSL